MIENVSLAIQGVWSHKLRSFLTMLGIIIGIASIITIVSTIKGTNEQIKKNLIGAGTDVVTVSVMQNGYETDFNWAPLPDGVLPITEETRKELEDLPGVKQVSLYNERPYTDNVYYLNTAFNGNLLGVDSRYFEVNNIRLDYGRNFIQSDFDNAKKVIIIDDKVAKDLFQGTNPIGEILEISEEPFMVIGVVSQHVETEPVINTIMDYYTYSDTSGGNIYMTGVCWPMVGRYDEPQKVAVRANSTDDMTKAGNNVSKVLKEKQISSDDYTYEANNLLEQATDLQNLSNTTNAQLIWIAGISLLVGGIGVMNIMLVSVTERTKEIGLKIAIGAKQKRIMWQFLTEAAVLTSWGGILGVGVGIGLAFMLSKVMGTAVAISGPACLIAFFFSMIIGVVFGLAPAMKASKLNPIEALRRE